MQGHEPSNDTVMQHLLHLIEEIQVLKHLDSVQQRQLEYLRDRVTYLEIDAQNKRTNEELRYPQPNYDEPWDEDS